MQKLNLAVAITCSGLLLPNLSHAKVSFEAEEFFAHRFTNGDLSSFLEDKGIVFDCELPIERAVARAHTGVVVHCATSITRERTRYNLYENIRRRVITRATSLENGVVHGFMIRTDENGRWLTSFAQGRYVQSIRSPYYEAPIVSTPPDCLKMIDAKELLPVPEKVRFVARVPKKSCAQLRERFSSNPQIHSNCTDQNQESLVEGTVQKFNRTGRLAAQVNYRGGALHGLTIEFHSDLIRMMEFRDGIEVRYASFSSSTCERLAASDPKLRPAQYTAGQYWSHLSSVRAYRPDSAAAGSREIKRRHMAEMIFAPVHLLGAPLLVWVFPDRYDRDTRRSGSLAYYNNEGYGELSFGLAMVHTQSLSANFHKYHYMFKYLDRSFFWGPRYSWGIMLFPLTAEIQGGVYFSGIKPAQSTIDLCTGLYLSACIGGRWPLRSDAKKLEKPLQFSVRFGF